MKTPTFVKWCIVLLFVAGVALVGYPLLAEPPPAVVTVAKTTLTPVALTHAPPGTIENTTEMTTATADTHPNALPVIYTTTEAMEVVDRIPLIALVASNVHRVPSDKTIPGTVIGEPNGAAVEATLERNEVNTAEVTEAVNLRGTKRTGFSHVVPAELPQETVAPDLRRHRILRV